MLLRGPQTIVVDPGMHLQNEPVIRALEARGLGVADLDLVVLTHAHFDHAGGCADVPVPVAVHELERGDPYWAMVGGMLPRERLRLLRGDEGELADGITGRARRATPPARLLPRRDRRRPRGARRRHHRPGARRLRHAAAGIDDGSDPVLAASLRAIASWGASLIIAGHVPPFRPGA